MFIAFVMTTGAPNVTLDPVALFAVQRPTLVLHTHRFGDDDASL